VAVTNWMREPTIPLLSRPGYILKVFENCDVFFMLEFMFVR
jgi:hypothetical protein